MERPNILRWLRHPSEMIDWFRDKMQDFFTLPARIAATRREAVALQKIMEDKGDSATAAQLQQVQHDLSRVSANHQSMQSRVSDLFAKLGALGIKLPGLSGYPSGYRDLYASGQLGILPAIPVAVLVAGGAVAVGIAAIFADYQKQRNIVEAVKQGKLTAEQAKALGVGRPLLGIDLGKMAFPLALVAGLVLFGPQLMGRR